MKVAETTQGLARVVIGVVLGFTLGVILFQSNQSYSIFKAQFSPCSRSVGGQCSGVCGSGEVCALIPTDPNDPNQPECGCVVAPPSSSSASSISSSGCNSSTGVGCSSSASSAAPCCDEATMTCINQGGTL